MEEKHANKPERSANADGRKKKTTTVVYLNGKPPGGAAAGHGKAGPPVRKKRVTLADIARHAEVSSSTVSIVLADRRDIAISETTRDRIKRSAGELGYFPSRLGRGFLHGQSKLIGVLVMVGSDIIPFQNCMDGIQEGLAASDYIPIVMSSNWMSGYAHGGLASDQDPVDDLPDLRRLLEYQVEGILYFSTDAAHAAVYARELSKRKIPTVVLGGAAHMEDDVDIVGGDNEAIGRMAAEHLLSSGCASFAYGRSTVSHPLEESVRAGFAARLEAAGHTAADFVMDADEEGRDDLADILPRLVRPPAGIFSPLEDVAISALRAAFSIGWRVPDECAVTGMGRATLSRYSPFPITTIDRNSSVAGETAAKLLVRRIEGFAGPPERILIPPTLQARSSTVSDKSWWLCSEKCR